MSERKSILRAAVNAGVFMVGLFAVLGLLAGGASSNGGDLVLIELVTGFIPFLRERLPLMSWDAGTWGPGVGAFLLVTLAAHRPLAAWARRSGRHWSFATTLCLALLVPVLFAISCLVPGVLLQWEALRQVPWIDVR